MMTLDELIEKYNNRSNIPVHSEDFLQLLKMFKEQQEDLEEAHKKAAYAQAMADSASGRDWNR